MVYLFLFQEEYLAISEKWWWYPPLWYLGYIGYNF